MKKNNLTISVTTILLLGMLFSCEKEDIIESNNKLKENSDKISTNKLSPEILKEFEGRKADFIGKMQYTKNFDISKMKKGAVLVAKSPVQPITKTALNSVVKGGYNSLVDRFWELYVKKNPNAEQSGLFKEWLSSISFGNTLADIYFNPGSGIVNNSASNAIHNAHLVKSLPRAHYQYSDTATPIIEDSGAWTSYKGYAIKLTNYSDKPRSVKSMRSSLTWLTLTITDTYGFTAEASASIEASTEVSLSFLASVDMTATVSRTIGGSYERSESSTQTFELPDVMIPAKSSATFILQHKYSTAKTYYQLPVRFTGSFGASHFQLLNNNMLMLSVPANTLNEEFNRPDRMIKINSSEITYHPFQVAVFYNKI